MLGWLRKTIKRSTCQHYKKFGDKRPTNMVEVARFSPYKKDSIGYGVSQCMECGKRAFSCIGFHMMGPQMEKAIDDFIAYKMTDDDFKAFLEKHMKSYTFTPHITNGGTNE